MLLYTNGYVPNEIVNAHYNYTAHETDLLLTIINLFKNEPTLSIKFDTLTFNYGEGHNKLETLRNSIHGILSKPLEYYKPSPEENKKGVYVFSAIVTTAKIDVNRNIVHFTFSPDIMHVIARSKEKYTRYNFQVLLNLESRYSKRIYLLCNAWKTTGLWECPIDRLRKILKLENKYSQFADLKKRVLNPAFEELNEKSEYKIEPEYFKQGKEINKLLCTVVLKTENVKPQSDQFTKLSSMGLAIWQCTNVVNHLEPNEIKNVLNDMIMNGHAIKNKGGYLVKIFKAMGVPLEQKLY